MKIFLITVMFCLSLPALAALPDEMLADPAQESRARAISKNLRCMVCDGQSIDDSDAALAADLRVLVREKILAGATDAAIYAYAREKYGDAVLMSPPKTAKTAVLWIAPLVFFACGIGAIVVYVQRGR